MPTPQQSSQYAFDGNVAGLTWDDFLRSFNTTVPNGINPATDPRMSGQTFTTINGIPVIGQKLATNTGLFGGESGGGGFGTPTFSDDPNFTTYATPNLGNGTHNVYSRGPNGELISHNETINNDSWWDSTGLPLVASLAFGGATGLASAAGVGAGTAGGLGAGATGAFDLGGTIGGVAGAGGYAADLAAAYGLTGTPSALAAAAGTGSSYASAGDLGLDNPNGYEFQNVGDVVEEPTSALVNGSQINYLPEIPVTGPPLTAAAGGAAAGGGLTFSELLPFLGVGGLAAGLGAGLAGGGGSAGAGLNSGDTGAFDQTGSQGTNLNNASGSGSDWFSSLVKGLGGASGLLNLGGNLASAILGSNAAKNAASTQSNAAEQANQLATQIFQQNSENNAPYLGAGKGAVGTLSDLYGLNGAGAQQTAYGNFNVSPDYKFAFDQGQKAVQSSAAARGGLYSGRAAKDLETFGQGLATQQYGNYTGGLRNLAGLGQAAAAGQAANGNTYSNAYGNNLTSGAAATAAGQVGSSNAITGAISSALGNYSQNALLNAILNNRGTGYYGG